MGDGLKPPRLMFAEKNLQFLLQSFIMLAQTNWNLMLGFVRDMYLEEVWEVL